MKKFYTLFFTVVLLAMTALPVAAQTYNGCQVGGSNVPEQYCPEPYKTWRWVRVAGVLYKVTWATGR